jgi:DNA-binding MarR family transcriptional regulator
VSSVPQALGRLRVALDDSFERVSGDFGLSAQQAELLCAAMRPAAVGEIAHVLRCDRSNVTRLADRAVQRGLVTRRPGERDARVTVLELSPDGMEIARRFIAALEDELAELLATWSERRQREAVSMLTELSAGLEERGRRAERPRAPAEAEARSRLTQRPGFT